ncbi:MAG: hypothetical protein P8106_03710 [Gammaproteobacteria bacterium]
MKIAVFLLILIPIFSGCSLGDGKPSTVQIQDSLETAFRDDLQRTLDMAGAQRTQEAVGVSNPSEISVRVQGVEDGKALDNGDYVARVMYVKRMGANESMVTARATLSKVEGRWKLVRLEDL